MGSMGMTRILASEYYIATLLLLTSYAWTHWRYRGTEITMRTFSLQSVVEGSAPLESEPFGVWEWRIAIVCMATAAWRIYNTTASLHGACFTALGFAQLFVIAMACLANRAVSGLYIMASVLSFLLLEQPQVNDPQDVEVLTPVTLKEKARDPATAEQGVAYLVFLYTPWSLSCRHAFSIFVDLAASYSTDRVRFARIDISEWQHVATQLGIDASPGSAFLPSVVLFENGQEVLRLPRRSGRTNTLELRKEYLVRMFELDMRYATSMSHQRRATPAEGANSSGSGGNNAGAGAGGGDAKAATTPAPTAAAAASQQDAPAPAPFRGSRDDGEAS